MTIKALIPLFLFLTACGGLMRLETGDTDGRDASAQDAGTVVLDGGADTSDASEAPDGTCFPKGGTVITDQIDAAACLQPGMTGGDITCYTLTDCTPCCVEGR